MHHETRMQKEANQKEPAPITVLSLVEHYNKTKDQVKVLFKRLGKLVDQNQSLLWKILVMMKWRLAISLEIFLSKNIILCPLDL